MNGRTPTQTPRTNDGGNGRTAEVAAKAKAKTNERTDLRQLAHGGLHLLGGYTRHEGVARGLRASALFPLVIEVFEHSLHARTHVRTEGRRASSGGRRGEWVHDGCERVAYVKDQNGRTTGARMEGWTDGRMDG